MANIKTGADFIKEAINVGYGDAANWTIDNWNDQIAERFNSGRELYSFRITDITEKSILGATGNYFGMIKMMNNLDRIIENETDPVKKAMAMAVRHVGFPECEKIIENNTLESVKNFRNEIINNPENKVSPKAIKEFDERVAVSNRAVTGRPNFGNVFDPNEVRYEDIPSNEQLVLIQTLIGSFMDRSICRDRAGEVLPETQPMKDLLGRINSCATDIIGKINGEKGANFKPSDDREKADFEALKNQVKEYSPNLRAEYSDEIKGFSTIAKFAEMNITPSMSNVTLTLDKNPIVTTTAEAFTEKQKNGSLSFAEIEWGESNIDNMVESIYTTDELKQLKSAGIDPAMGILVDGKPLDWKPGKPTTTLETAKTKCEIVSKAMQGSNLSVTKIVPDGMGGFKAGYSAAAKTDLSMNTEKRSIWTILKQLFGFIFSLKDKVAQANKEAETYFVDNSQVTTTARKSIEAAQLKELKTERENETSAMDVDFYSAVYPTTEKYPNTLDAISAGIQKDAAFSSGINPNSTNEILQTLGRSPSRVNLAIVYGLSKGHSYEDLTANTAEAKALRQNVGRDFVEEFKVCRLEEYAKSKGLEADSADTRKQYNDFVLGKFENVERILAKGCEEYVKLPITKIEPSNRTDYIHNVNSFDKVAKMAKDISQSFASLKTNYLAPTDPKVSKAFERMSAVFNYTSSQLEPVTKLGMINDNYFNFIQSDEFVHPGDEPVIPVVDSASKGRAFMTFFNENSEHIRTVDDLNKDKDLSENILALAFACYEPFTNSSTYLAKQELKAFIPCDAPYKPIKVNPQTKKIEAFGAFTSYQNLYNLVKVDSDSFTQAFDEYSKILPENQRNLPLSERIEAIKAAEAIENTVEKTAEAPKKKIAFADLVSEKNQINEKPKEAAPKEKTLDLGGMKK